MACNASLVNTSSPCFSQPGNQTGMVSLVQYGNDLLGSGTYLLGSGFVFIFWMVSFTSFIYWQQNLKMIKSLMASSLLTSLFAILLNSVNLISPLLVTLPFMTFLGSLIIDYVQTEERGP